MMDKGKHDRIRGVVCFASVDWQFLKQRAHHLMTALAGRGLKVLFIENTGVRTPSHADAARIKKRLANAINGSYNTNDSLPENLDVFSPLAFPFPYHPVAVWGNKQLFRHKINNFLTKNNLTPEEVVFWTYLATPAILETASSMSWGRVVYDVVSDPEEVEPRLALYERKMLYQADIVLFASNTLKEQYQLYTTNPLLFRDGFNTELAAVDSHIPPEIANLHPPRILYLGGINRKFWVEALEAISIKLPGASIILLGLVDQDKVKLPDAPNVHLFPVCGRYEDLAGFLNAADIALIPYRPDRYAGALQPAKLNEYMVFGLPVVATATTELSLLAREWPEKTFYLVETPEEFAQAIVRALSEDCSEIREKRRLVTRNASWESRVDNLIKCLDN